jgi:hypothetical protein
LVFFLQVANDLADFLNGWVGGGMISYDFVPVVLHRKC